MKKNVKQFADADCLDKIASVADEQKYKLPAPSIDGCPYDFSFSGLKTAVINTVHNAAQKGNEIDIPVLSATVRERVCDMLIDKTLKAAENLGYKKIAVAGGVAANSRIRRDILSAAEKLGVQVYLPPLSLCGDNAAMIGAQGYYEYLAGKRADLDLNAYATRDISLG